MSDETKRVWLIDYLEGWTATITEQEDKSLVVVVTHGEQAWRAVKHTIDEALAVATRIIAEQTPQDNGTSETTLSCPTTLDKDDKPGS